MAAKKVNSLVGQQELSTKTITYSTELGRGAFATVYKAKCDGLPCAAKILHAIFHNDPGLESLKRRFYQECEYLKSIKHPNIVQYLGLCQDPATNQPVLLMELMDQSLTNFLESSTVPLSRSVQFRLCHDITSALAHLHSFKIIHRDLSSNNVLVGPGRRAKVSDFGMSKVIDTTKSRHTTPLTMVPGTVVYMPQEAMGEDPIYTEKLDCFSFGVLAVQIITGLFPDPLPRTKRVESALSPSGTIQVAVLETECRKEHIDMIDATHPLLSISIDCLALKMEERPNARELCERIEVLADFPTDLFNDFASWEEVKRQYEEEILSLRQRLEAFESQSKNAGMKHCSKCKELTAIKKDPERKLKAANLLPLPTDGGLAIKSWKTGCPAPESVARSFSTVLQNNMICSLNHLIYNYDIPGDRWKVLPEIPTLRRNQLAVVFHTELGRLYAFKDKMMYIMYDGKWSVPGSVYTHLLIPLSWAYLPYDNYFLLLGSDGYVYILRPMEASVRSSLFLAPNIRYTSARICNGAVYLIGTNITQTWTEKVFKYPLADIVSSLANSSWFSKKTGFWQETASLPVTRSTCVSFNNRLLAVGGLANNQPSGDIFLYDEEQDKWEVIGRIPTPRYNCLAEVVGDQLVVVGGWLNHFTKCDKVEIATLNF